MRRPEGLSIDNQWITSHRGGKNLVDPFRPNGYFLEEEYIGPGRVENVITILLTNAECPYRCLMCDLWKNTADGPVPVGAIPEQIRFALSGLPHAKHLKLYNSGSFFDRRAIPPEDYTEMARLIENFDTLTVESHPFFINQDTLAFRDLIKPALEVAIGLETVKQDLLAGLNKKMDLADFRRSVTFLKSHGIQTRAFILLRPPFLSEDEGVHWANKSIEYAFMTGVSTCVVIPVRSGNGALDVLASQNLFAQPGIPSLERVTEYGIRLHAGPVFADLWDIDRFATCHRCFPERKQRLIRMNLQQEIPPAIECSCTGR